eukprot:TRINITY_DN3202_c0_g1_i3.p1 TRINITY_DN3202_c0_g1~~TRINITY_DN3202_c0_g1_i3.p1  ORF type:complete len:598 (-),score=135.17 TRINITY_DN3202_c0_g1_i3:367-2160(-)
MSGVRNHHDCLLILVSLLLYRTADGIVCPASHPREFVLVNTSFSPLPFLTQKYGSTRVYAAGGPLSATPYLQFTDGPRMTGNVRLPVPPTVPTPVASFTATFEAYVFGGYGGADGFGFFFSDLPSSSYAGDEELGSGAGLRLSFLTGTSPSLQIIYNQQLLQVFPHTFRGPGWANYTVDITTNGILNVQHNGASVVTNYLIVGWNPLYTWVFGFGARCGVINDAGYYWDNHAIRNVNIVGCTNYTVPRGSGPWFCGGGMQMTGPSDTLFAQYQASQYNPNMLCSWSIEPLQAADNQVVVVTFSAVATEANIDVVRFYDGPNATYPLIGTVSGTPSVPLSIVSTGPRVYVTWYSDGTLQSTGFQAQYYLLPASDYNCTGLRVLTNASGTFRDHAGNGPYISNLDCRWLISLPVPTDVVLLNFTSFSTGTGEYVYVYDGDNVLVPALGAFSGTTLPSVMSSAGPTTYLRLTSGINQHGQGFTVSYSSVPSTIYCSGVSALPAAQTPASFSSNSGIGSYKANSNCTWLFQANATGTVFVVIRTFVLDSSDVFRIYDGASFTAPLRGNYRYDLLAEVFFFFWEIAPFLCDVRCAFSSSSSS